MGGIERFFSTITETALPWLQAHGIAILIIIVGAYLVRRFGRLVSA